MIAGKSVKQLVLYFIVGLIATFVEWGAFYILDGLLSWHYAFATAVAFVFSTAANWWFGRILLFKRGDARGLLHEILSIYMVSIAGLLANVGIMYVCIEWMHLPDMMAKVIATGIVFFGNFAVRKFFIYKV